MALATAQLCVWLVRARYIGWEVRCERTQTGTRTSRATQQKHEQKAITRTSHHLSPRTARQTPQSPAPARTRTPDARVGILLSRIPRRARRRRGPGMAACRLSVHLGYKRYIAHEVCELGEELGHVPGKCCGARPAAQAVVEEAAAPRAWRRRADKAPTRRARTCRQPRREGPHHRRTICIVAVTAVATPAATGRPPLPASSHPPAFSPASRQAEKPHLR